MNKYAYDAFGKVLSQTEAISNPFKFVGAFGVMDEGNGLLYMRARYYDPSTGRFISKDPIGWAGGLNLYGYVGGNPVNRIDPSGLLEGLFPGQGPQWHHMRNLIQACPEKESGCKSGNWFYEGNSQAHGGYRSYRGTGSNRGFQCVYYNNGTRVDNREFMGTYDYSPPYNDGGTINIPSAIGHVADDIIPWLLFGN